MVAEKQELMAAVAAMVCEGGGGDENREKERKLSLRDWWEDLINFEMLVMTWVGCPPMVREWDKVFFSFLP